MKKLIYIFLFFSVINLALCDDCQDLGGDPCGKDDCCYNGEPCHTPHSCTVTGPCTGSCDPDTETTGQECRWVLVSYGFGGAGQPLYRWEQQCDNVTEEAPDSCGYDCYDNGGCNGNGCSNGDICCGDTCCASNEECCNGSCCAVSETCGGTKKECDPTDAFTCEDVTYSNECIDPTDECTDGAADCPCYSDSDCSGTETCGGTRSDCSIDTSGSIPTGSCDSTTETDKCIEPNTACDPDPCPDCTDGDNTCGACMICVNSICLADPGCCSDDDDCPSQGYSDCSSCVGSYCEENYNSNDCEECDNGTVKVKT